ncbi:hypothetical protein [Bacillus massiliglaciei]|uniref:hypothetical protein n=1 Tax=Bacillus massiliglaciei TaxID=1816693 RepID=UPI000DA63E35|nr:hypothetical protein [Bacillus massiliglaciei]
MLKKWMIYSLLFIIAIVSISGVVLADNQKTRETKEAEKQFDSEQEALKYAKKKNPYMEEIIGETKITNHEKVVLYTFQHEHETGVGTGTLTYKDAKVVWEKNGADLVISNSKNQQSTNLSGDVTTPSGNRYTLYAGAADSKKIRIETETDNGLTPHIDRKHKIYYLLIPKLGKS